MTGMGMKNNIYPLRLHEVIDYTPIQGTYAFNSRGKFPLLQKICFWVLSKLDCTSSEISVRMKVREFDSERLIDIITKQEEVIYQITSKRAKYVLVGRDHYDRLIGGESDYMTHWMFEFPPYYQTRQAHPNSVFVGIKVVFVPWMNGMVVIPELPA